MLGLVFDVLAVANWQRGGGKGTRPKPIAPVAKKKEPDPTRLGSATGRTNEEVIALLETRRNGA